MGVTFLGSQKFKELESQSTSKYFSERLEKNIFIIII
jgi:hypothetical protein